MKKIIIAVLCCFIVLSNLYSENSIPKVQKELPFSKGLNLSNWLEYSRNNTMRFGKKDFENIKSLGVEVIRLPVWFEIWNEGAPDYKISDECWLHLDNAIDWCQELGMYIIIDFHNDCNGSSKTDSKIEKVLLKIWPQIAERYKDKGEHILYEIMNEPHFKSGNLDADLNKWAKVQGRVLKAIREIDTKHLVIVGGGDWNSSDSMFKLPDYQDENLVYNFHDYSPFLFTHQGASWTYIKRLTGIPFPYVKEKMPKLPKNANSAEKGIYNSYKRDSSEETLVAPLNKAVEFVNKRKASLMCNEFGVHMNYADPQERVNWYRIKIGWMDERNIARVSWDYTNSNGIFKNPSEIRFPEDLNKPLVEAMGYNVPSGKSESWLELSDRTGEYKIYQNGLGEHLSADYHSLNRSKSIVQLDRETNEMMLEFTEMDTYGEFSVNFGELCDFTGLKDSGAKLEFFIKSEDKNLEISAYFKDSDRKSFPWRAGVHIKAREFGADGEWHKISLPLNKFSDWGGWSSAEGWKESEGKFDWTIITSFVLQNGDKATKDGFCIRDLKIVR